MPGTRPARGWLQVVDSSVAGRQLPFCRADQRHVDWLPQAAHYAAGSSSPRAKHCLPCPTLSLLPRHGDGVAPLTPCTVQRFEVLQTLTPELLLTLSTLKRKYAVRRMADRAPVAANVLLVVSDNRGHGLFAMVERVANQILYARAIGLEPFVVRRGWRERPPENRQRPTRADRPHGARLRMACRALRC